VSTALFQRTHTGKGQMVDVSMLEATLAFLSGQVANYNQHRQLRRVQHQRPTRLDVRGPEEYAVLEPLGEEAEAGAIPERDF
jgi:crotonobetainyl-CoA:carnitine CoA-transferase CaiB-like acyl-CoA transferase